MGRPLLLVCLIALATPAWAGDSGALWLRPDTSGEAGEIVIRRNLAGPLRFTISTPQPQVLDERFKVIGPFGVPVYTNPIPPHVFGPGSTSITISSLVLVPGEYRVHFGGQGQLLQVTVPDSPMVLSGLQFDSAAPLTAEPATGDYTFHVPAGTTSFGLSADVAGFEPGDYLEVEVRDGDGTAVAAYGCGEPGSPYPTPCLRLPVAVPEGADDAFWQLHLVHSGRLVLALDGVPSVLSISAADWFEPGRFVIDPRLPGGRDCLSLGGAWDGAHDRCAVAEWWLHPADSLEILEPATLEFGDLLTNPGTIVNHGTLINAGLLESTGTIVNHGTIENLGAVTSAGAIANLGVFANHGHLTNTGTFDNSGVLQNFCSGVIDGGGEFTGDDPLPEGLDLDGDGVCQKADCAPEDPTTWSSPGEVRELALTAGPRAATTLSWAPPLEGGGTVLLYDVLRSGFADFPGASACVAAGVTAPGADDADLPAESQAFYYVVVAANGCGAGPAGTASDGTPRTTTLCP